jgi:lysophospholipase L1-like esterase
MSTARLFLVVLALTASCRRDVPSPIRVACVGDSITEGLNILQEGKQTYPKVLQTLSEGQWDVRNFGVSGATLLQQGDRPYRTQPAFREALAFRPHVVVIQLGSNDSKPNNWMYGRRFKEDYKDLIRAFQALSTRPKIWICCPVPAFSRNYALFNDVIRHEIRPLVKDIGAEVSVPVIDLYAKLENQGDLFPDQIHPNAEGARRIAEAIYRTISPELSAEPALGRSTAADQIHDRRAL